LAADLKQQTLEALRSGIANSDQMRSWIAARTGEMPDSRFVNAHAWALVRLQKEGLIEKLETKTYRLLQKPEADQSVPPPSESFTPKWAKKLIHSANSKNAKLAPGLPKFTEQDLLHLWNACGGRCSVTGLPFSSKQVGEGKAKRVYAPSLDRIVAGGAYSRENCRLVMVGINFAINSWGLDTYLELAEAAVKRQES
jgi:hypothetical protein